MNVLLVSDFFFPNLGGLEGHMFLLSQHLIRKNYNVIILSHHYPQKRAGIRYLSRGLKVYYLPHWVIHDQASFPTVYSWLPYFRQLIYRERIDLVHAHGAFSSLSHEAILYARTMNIPAVFTDHSLFGFEDVSSILTNKLLQFTLSDVNAVICVSNTCKENTVLRANLDPKIVSVIPNAIVASQFIPDPSKLDPKYITIVYAGRLAYRRGADLMVKLIPRICAKFPMVRFLIAGDGNKRVDFEQMRETELLQDRVIMLGTVKHSQIRDELFVKGDIYLNTTLTEAFCISIVEAACCGLLVVSTKVGGIPEVLPDDMIVFANPTVDDLVEKLQSAIYQIQKTPIDRPSFHSRVESMYSWENVADRTILVYQKATKDPKLHLHERFQLYYHCGPWAGKMACMVIAALYMYLWFLEWLVPKDTIDVVPKVTVDDIVSAYDEDLQRVDS
ncbi:hypothetical protein HK098_004671 [Nowakowskiella sp. JEL0407]|nr:hypothetical protein HK098_004671 [Nowakowskiella sp. JEL0407]